jgi:hypothetical protein
MLRLLLGWGCWYHWTVPIYAQFFAPLAPFHVPPDPDTTGTCDLSVFGDKIDSLNRLCTGAVCTVDCAIRLLPLLHDCRVELDAVYDDVDGNMDGVASVFDTASESCLAIPSHDVLQRVEQLHAAGVCPDEVLDDVAEVDVEVDVQCRDENPNCPSFLSMGVTCDNLAGQCDVTCEMCVVCEDANANCANFLTMGVTCASLAGTCDATCGLCGPVPGGHRRSLAGNAFQHQNQPGRGRRIQDSIACDLSAYVENIAKIDSACCDGTDGVCANGAN